MSDRVTEFQQRVYDALAEVPRGKVTTYGWLAALIGCDSARAVGQALRRNPFAPRVACHRVIGADLTLRGYQGRTRGAALRRKREVLASEGVEFRDGKLADRGRLFAP